jgi:hypothetical protein
MIDLSALTGADWLEIYYAVRGKEEAILRGEYGPTEPDCDMKEWADHMKEIRGKLEAALDAEEIVY